MVAHMVFTPAFFFETFRVLSSLPKAVGVLIAGVAVSSAAAGPFESRLLGVTSLVRGNKSELVAAADGPARERAPTSPSPGLFLGLDAAMVDEDVVDEDGPLSRRHSSLWPARQAARWQAWPQYFRCLHPVQKRSLSFAGARQFAHTALIALGTTVLGSWCTAVFSTMAGIIFSTNDSQY